VKILIVVDEEIISSFFVQLAKMRGCTEIETVGSGEEALTRVIRKTYDLITLDILMPGVSGLEIIGMLRNMCPHAIIAIISGFIPDEISDEVAGCADVIMAKPVTPALFGKLLDCTEQIVDTMSRLRTLGTDPATYRSD